MVSLIAFNDSDDPEEELELGSPDAAEANDLPRHVSRCAMRYKLLTKRLKKNSTQTSRIEWLLYGVGAYMLGFTNGPVHDFIKGLL